MVHSSTNQDKYCFYRVSRNTMDTEERIENKERAVKQVCENLHFMKFIATNTGDVKALCEIMNNIRLHCPEKEQKIKK